MRTGRGWGWQEKGRNTVWPQCCLLKTKVTEIPRIGNCKILQNNVKLINDVLLKELNSIFKKFI